MATCHNLVEVAVDSSADIVIWAFSAQGLGTAWSMRTGQDATLTRTAVQKDGSIRYVDSSGDVVIGGVDVPLTQTLPIDELSLLDGASASASAPTSASSHSHTSRVSQMQRGQRPTRHDGIVRAG